MPRRDGAGVIEVRVGWKSQAETLIHVPRPTDRATSCRPKRLLVASGGEYHTTGGRRSVVLRGITLLSAEDGGRSALLQLLAAGVPREGKFVALAAPIPQSFAGDFEVRALRLWRRTLFLPRKDPITSNDLLSVNKFRSSLDQLQQRRAHRLAGPWQVIGSDEIRYIECVDASSHGRSGSCDEGALFVSGGSASLWLWPDSHAKWRVETEGEASLMQQAQVSTVEEDSPGVLCWSDGSRWERQHALDSEEIVLQGLSPQVVECFCNAAEEMLSITTQSNAVSGDVVRRWPGRLVPVYQCSSAQASSLQGRSLVPLDLSSMESQLKAFATRLSEANIEETGTESGSDAEDGSDDDADADCPVDVSQERVDEQYMWRVAEENDWGPGLSCDPRNLCFVESALAMPPSAICVECEQEGKMFSKSQLSRHPEDRRCQDCVRSSCLSVYRPAREMSAVVVSATKVSTELPLVNGVAAQTTSQPVVCSACGVQLTRQNLSDSQKKKTPSRRRCNDCVKADVTAT